MSERLYDLIEQRIKEAERERKAAKERFKLLATEIRDLKVLLTNHTALEKQLPKGSTTPGGKGGQKSMASGVPVKPV